MPPRASTATRAKPAQPAAKPRHTSDDLAAEISATETDQAPRKNSDDLFAPLSEETEFARCLFWGKEGSSKTTSACKAANHGRVLVVNAEGGLKIKALRNQGVQTENLRQWPRPNSGVRITHAGLDKVFRQVKADLREDPNSWFAIIIDSASDVVTSMVEHVSDDRIRKMTEKGVEIDEVDAFETDRNDYGTMSKMFRDILRKYRNLPCHLIITALERSDEDKSTGRTTIGPAVPPAIQTDLLAYVDSVLYFKAEDEDGPFRAATRKAAKYRAKDRLGVLPPVLALPTFDRILAYLDGTLTAETDPEQASLPAPRSTGRKTPVARKGRKTSKATADEPTETDEN